MAMYIGLVPVIGWKGAALGTVIGEAVLAAAAWIVLIHCQRVDDGRYVEGVLDGDDLAEMAGPPDGSQEV